MLAKPFLLSRKLSATEVSNMGSPNTYKEFIAGLRDGGEITFEGNYIPKDATQINVRADLDAGTLSVLKDVPQAAA